MLSGQLLSEEKACGFCGEMDLDFARGAFAIPRVVLSCCLCGTFLVDCPSQAQHAVQGREPSGTSTLSPGLPSVQLCWCGTAPFVGTDPGVAHLVNSGPCLCTLAA